MASLRFSHAAHSLPQPPTHCFQRLQDCMAVRHEAVQESVPEAVKNMLLVLASSGILTPQWRVSSFLHGYCCLRSVATIQASLHRTGGCMGEHAAGLRVDSGVPLFQPGAWPAGLCIRACVLCVFSGTTTRQP